MSLPNKFLFSAMISLLLVFGMVTSFTASQSSLTSKIEDALRIGVAVIDTSQLERINDRIYNNDNPLDIAQDSDYISVSNALIRLRNAVPFKAQWTYTMLSPQNERMEQLAQAKKIVLDRDYAVMSVLTIPTKEGDVSSYPGFFYDVSEYPQMKDVITGHKELAISGLVYDKVYGLWTRSGFIHIEKDGEVVGILGIDIQTEEVLKPAFDILWVLILYTLLAMLIGVYMVSRYIQRPSEKKLPEYEEICAENGCKDEESRS